MREIKFRAMRVDNGEWVYGSLIVLDRGLYIVDTNHYNTISADLHEKLEINALWEDNDFKRVNENTICQFTGLCDKNGKEVYEGDIIKHFMYKTIDGKSKYITFCINWGDDNRYRAYKNGLKGYSYEISFANYVYNPKDNEVIGNIYDNPELLKGE